MHPTETTTWAIFGELRMAANVWGNASYAEWAASAEVQATGCLNLGVQNCSDDAAVLWWPTLEEEEEEEENGEVLAEERE